MAMGILTHRQLSRVIKSNFRSAANELIKVRRRAMGASRGRGRFHYKLKRQIALTNESLMNHR